MFEHLSNPEYLHVLLNPLPVYGLAMGVLGLVVALILRSRRARVTALVIVFISTLSAWPVYHYGEAGYDRVLSMSDDPGSKWLDEHKRRGEMLIFAFYGVAALSAVAVATELKMPRVAWLLGFVTALMATVNIGVGAYISYPGGRIRHREFRFEPAPESSPSSSTSRGEIQSKSDEQSGHHHN